MRLDYFTIKLYTHIRYNLKCFSTPLLQRDDNKRIFSDRNLQQTHRPLFRSLSPYIHIRRSFAHCLYIRDT